MTEDRIERTGIIIDAKSGVSGAGKKPTETTHFVSVDENGKPIPVPPFVPATDEQKRLARYAMDVKAALDAIVELKPAEVAKGQI